MIKICEWEGCAKPLARRPGELKQAYLKRRHCNRECVNRKLSEKLKQPINHGTLSGYNIHLRRGEKPSEVCSECHTVRLEWQRARYPETKGYRSSAKVKAQRRALRLLVAAHEDEYRALVEQECAS